MKEPVLDSIYQPEHAPDAFAGIPVTAPNHFLVHFYATVFRVIYYLYKLIPSDDEALETLFEEHPFLAGYFAEIVRLMPDGLTWEQGAAWWEHEIAAWERHGPDHLPLRALGETVDVPLRGRLAYILAGLVEEDMRFGTLFATLQAPLEHRRLGLEWMGRILAGEQGLEPWSMYRPLLAHGFLEPLNREAPRSEWILRVPGVLWDAARGETAVGAASWYAFHEADDAPPLDALIFPERFLAQAAQVPTLIEADKAEALVVRGTPGSERLPVVRAIARLLGRNVLAVSGDALETHRKRLGPLCTLTGSLPVVTYDLTPGAAVDVPELSGYLGPMAFVVGLAGGLRGSIVEKVVTLTVPRLKTSERRRHWQAAFQDHPVAHLDEINERFYLPGGYIRRAASVAVAQAGLEGHARVTIDDVRQACRTLNRQLLDTLAEHLETRGSWDLLVVTETMQEKLREMEQRCRHRERLLDHLGPAFDTSANRGVRALFSGPSGTGKTLAAQILAAEIGMDLYRVDLAAIINKYIGETEKNLHRVLATAEELDVILLLDEADTLLGNRTNVKSANDRYANLETNYLLQRLEQYQGIIIMTTNLSENIDRAFERRMDISVEFLPPEAEARWHIWQLHLPQGYTVEEARLQDIAVRCALTGGQIRNAAFLATLTALDEGCEAVCLRHLEQAVRSEYRKAGATCPLSHTTALPPSYDGLQAFLNTLQAPSFET